MLLTVNIGNSRIAYGLFESGDLVRGGHVPPADISLLPELIGDAPIAGISLGSVAPTLTDRVIPLLSQAYGCGVSVAGRDLRFDMDIQYENPETVGVDRLLNAVAAYARIEAAVIVVDAGTAVTVDLVSDKGSFCGGAIAPGPRTMLRALAQFTEQLPEATVEKPEDPLGRNTTDCLRSGAWHGTVGMIRELVGLLRERHATDAALIVTGGWAELLAETLARPEEIVPHLGLEGLALLTERAGGGVA